MSKVDPRAERLISDKYNIVDGLKLIVHIGTAKISNGKIKSGKKNDSFC